MADMLPTPTLELKDFDGVPSWTDDALFAACGVRIAFAGRAGGVSSGPYKSLNLCGYVDDNPADVVRNRARVLEVLGAQGCSLFVPRQVHGTHIVVVDQACPPADERMEVVEADAVMVAAPGMIAQLSFADCLPLILVAPNGAFAVVHAGWRGAVAGIAGKVTRALCDAAACEAAQVSAYIGPHIRSECFETGPEVVEQFCASFGEGILVDERHISIVAAVTTDLVRAGMQAQRIADCQMCTMCNHDAYFSYRASGGVCGRNAVIAFRIDASQ